MLTTNRELTNHDIFLIHDWFKANFNAEDIDSDFIFEREDYVSVHISVTDENELRYNSSYNKSNNFQVTFDIPNEKYEDFLKDAQEILPEVDDGYYRDYDYYY